MTKNKRLVLFDGVGQDSISDRIAINSNLKTDILIRDLETGNIIAKSLHNKVVLPGAGFIARALFDVTTAEVTPSYNTALGITAPSGTTTEVPDFTNATEEHPKVLLFCVGTNGCGTEGSQVFTVDYNSWITPDSLVPFRYPLISNDINDDLKQSYVGRVEDGEYAAYYFKRFTSGPTLVQQYIDGTPIEGNVLETGMEVETYIETVLTITRDDCREFFVATTGIDEARFNSISLCYAYCTMIDGIPYFDGIRPLTRLNIPNEYLIDVTKGVEIIYHTYM